MTDRTDTTARQADATTLRPDPLAVLDEEIRYQRERYHMFVRSAGADSVPRKSRDIYHCDASRACEALNALERVRATITTTETSR